MQISFSQRRSGFTLLEMSVVLLIISLLIAGIMIGKTMTRSAYVRSDIASVGQFDAAYNLFQTKYLGIPGDYNLGTINGVTAGHYGNGNGKIEISAAYESAYLWEHLSKSGLIPGNYDGNTQVAINLKCSAGTSCPASKINGADSFIIGGVSAIASYIGSTPIYGITDTTSPVIPAIFWLDSAGGLTSGIKEIDAKMLDDKLDDGVAATGNLITINDAWAASNCINNGTWITDGSAVYNASDTLYDCFPIYMMR